VVIVKPIKQTTEYYNAEHYSKAATQRESTKGQFVRAWLVCSSHDSFDYVRLCWRPANSRSIKTMNSAMKRQLARDRRRTLIANVLGFAILAATVAAIYVINYLIILIRYGA